MSFQRETEVFYVTDAQFSVPTLVSIESLRRWPSARGLNINVVLLDMTEKQSEDFARIGEDLSLRIHFRNTKALAAFGNADFNATHVPIATLARFLISDLFENSNSDILYIDGDTLFIEDPAELLTIEAPEHGLLAAEDQSYFYAKDFGRTGNNVRSYFSMIGVSRAQGYFNAGLLKCRAQEWIRISADCLAFLRENLAACRYHDQSALNAVVGSKRTRLSPAWNFKPSYWDWGIGSMVQPKLLHFVGGDKPWMGTLEVWKDLYPSYTRAVERRMDGSFSLRRWDAQQQLDRLKVEKMQQLKNKSIFRLRVARRRAMFRQLIETSAL